MRLTQLLMIAAIAALAAGFADAQTSSGGTNDQSNTAAAGQAAAPSAATFGPGGVTSSPTPVDQAYKLKAGDVTVISNAPIPDTVANRQQFGGPMSNGGRHTAPAGN
jgi:hypothetical protein